MDEHSGSNDLGAAVAAPELAVSVGLSDASTRPLPALPTVLVVDDDVNVLHQVHAVLGGLCDVRVSQRAADVPRLCRLTPPDLLVLDFRLGDGDGLELVRQLRSDAALAAMQIMFLSGETDAEARARAFDLDALDWLVKPVDEALLRARVQAALARPRERAPGEADEQSRRHEPERVLVVDDDSVILDAIANTLAGEDIRLRTAMTAEEALTRVAEEVPSLVLMDIGLPTMNGFQLADRLLEHPEMADVPIIFVTQNGDVEAEIRALAMGAFDFVSKPFLPAVLRARVRNALRHRRRALATLDRVEARWQRISAEQVVAIVAHARDAILSLNEDGRVVLANHAAQRLLRAEEPLVGLPLPKWLRDVLAPELLAGQRSEAENVVLLPPGQAPMTCDVSAHLDRSSGRSLVTLTMKDQTLRLRAEAEARENLRAQAESQAKQLMMSYLAHEIGNPLNGVINLTALMLAPGAESLSADQTRRLKLVQSCADVLRHLMADALDLARWEAGQFALELVPTPLAPVLDYCVDTVAPLAQAGGLTIAAPQGDLDVLVLADGVRLRQCLHNLVNNASKYGKSGGTVQIDVLDAGAEVAIAVSDNGPGIEPDQMQRLFEPFDRLGRHGTSGHGLGLAVTRMLMQVMGGRIDVASTRGLGSRFTLVLRKPPSPKGPSV